MSPKCLQIVNAHTRQRSKNPAQLVMDSGEVVGLANHTALLARDGKEYQIADSAAPIRDAANQIIGIILIFSDVTSQYQAQEAISQREEQYRLLFEGISEGFALHEIICDSSGRPIDYRFLSVNPAFERMTGLNATQVIGRTILEAIPGTEASWIERYGRIALTGKAEHFEDFSGALGSHFKIEAFCPRPGQFVTVFENITDRKRTEAIMAARLRLLQSANSLSMNDLLRATLAEAESLTGSLVGFYHFVEPDQLTVTLKVWSANTDSMCKITAGKNHYAVNTAGVWVDCIHQRRPVIHNDYASLPHRKGMPEGHAPITRELVVPVMRNDVIVAVLGVGNKPTDYDERDVKAVESLADLAWDIAERKRAEEGMLTARTVAETATRVKEQFLAKLSHELRTPLTPVLLAISQWQTHAEFPLALRDDLTMICRNLELEARLLDDLLDVNRILYGKLSLRQEVLSVHQAINEALAIVAASVQMKQLQLILQLEAPRDHVEGDPARVRQVLWNLLSNAIKFTPQAGRVVVSTTNDSDGWICVTIADSGIGIDPEILSRLFSPFEQGGQHVNHQYGGMGLGLSICKSMAEAHNGTISAASEGKDKGTTFTVRLPLVQHPAPIEPARLPPKARVPASVGALRILLVEDHADTARIMSRLLRSKGHSVQVAGDVASGLQCAEKSTFDILVSDLGLPDGSGHDLMRQLVATGQAPPAIAVSGFGTEEDIRKSMEAGFAEHLVKPVVFATLLATIERVLRKQTCELSQTIN